MMVTIKPVHVVGKRDGMRWCESSENWEFWDAIKLDCSVLCFST